MDGERKKRKSGNDDADEENEEEKMEKFYALIRSIRDVRERLIGNTERPKEKEKEKVEEEKAAVVQNALFKPEDFMDEDQSKNHNVSREGPSKRVEESTEGGNGNGLNLKLSL